MSTIRPESKNMCSVRQSPMPSQPNFTATLDSCGVSQFTRKPMVRKRTAYSMTVAKSPESSGCTVATAPCSTTQVEERKSAEEGKSGSERVDLGGGLIIKKTKT